VSIKEEKEALRVHGIRWRLRGLPIFESPCSDVVIGYTSEDEWKWEDLTDTQQYELKKYADKEHKRALPMKWNITEDEALYYACADYGVECPHKWKNHEPFYRECVRCKTAEQLPGRIVRIGDKEMRVSDPPPRYVQIPRASKINLQYTMCDKDPVNSIVPMTCIEYDEYQWVYDHYEKVD